ncbi:MULTISPECIES: DUF2206 domain-containing protein [Methanobacterium]|uniref:DUF2206 domain-containing protein n=1 Tax=Methanobacterium bryantii TaxID=2161 RepID=A0A2A2H3N5_METBR|nr:MULTISPECIES: DUF2206 domain-containing protein [Methanobacterium]OEC86112.1 hypothetical protein A9507_11720 [Methanobacterium sp. A39]PAV03900.1 hypothetical protein ASJ80_02450 [Methanobacterium bryantii]
MNYKINYIYLVIAIIVVTNISIFLDIRFLREISSFLFLTILPGFLILKSLKIDNINITETVVLSVGTSIGFIMVYGLICNYLLFELGIITPLSTVPLLIYLDLALLVFIAIIYKLDLDLSFHFPEIGLNNYEQIILIIAIFFPILTIIGTNVVNMSGSNIFLMSLLLIIPATVLVICHKKISNKIYPFIIFLISISLVLMAALRSQHILGVDSHNEYYFFFNTLQNLHWSLEWSQFFKSPLDACVSISLLPAVYQSLMKINPEMLFKILYPLLYSVSPLAVYLISRKYVGDLYAFIAAFFFMSQINFLWTTSNARTNIAILFFSMMLLLLIDNKIKPLQRSILMVLFVISIVLSHYSTSFLVMGILLGSFIAGWIFSKFYLRRGVELNTAVTSSLIMLFFAFAFLWYSQITGFAFNSITGFLVKKVVMFNSFFIIEYKDVGVSAVLGEGLLQKSLPSQVNFAFLWLIILSIASSVFTLILKYKKMAFPDISPKKFTFIFQKFESDFFFLTLFSFMLLGVTLILPFLMIGYNVDRVFSMSIVMLATSFALSGLIISKVFSKIKVVKPYLILLIILIPYFLSVSGFTYQLMGDPNSAILNSYGNQYNLLYVHDSESEGAKWLEEYHITGQIILTDFYGDRRLLSQGNMRSTDNINWILQKEAHGYIYLRYQNIIYGELVDYNNHIYEMNDFKGILNNSNKIYDGGYSQIFLTS